MKDVGITSYSKEALDFAAIMACHRGDQRSAIYRQAGRNMPPVSVDRKYVDLRNSLAEALKIMKQHVSLIPIPGRITVSTLNSKHLLEKDTDLVSLKHIGDISVTEYITRGFKGLPTVIKLRKHVTAAADATAKQTDWTENSTSVSSHIDT